MEAIVEYMNARPLSCVLILVLIVSVLAFLAIAVQDKTGSVKDKPIRVIRDTKVCPYEDTVRAPSDADGPWQSYCLCEGAWVECRSTKTCQCKGVNATPSKI